MPTETESQVQTAILEYLIKRGHFAWRNNNQPTYDTKMNGGYGGYRAQSKWTPKGLPDVFVLHPGDTKEYPTPTLIGLEIKKPKGGKVSPDQLLVQRRFRLLNHVYEVVKSVEEVKQLGL
jgi:hypothetical protein